MLGLIGALLSLGLLIWFAYHGWNVIALSVGCALVAGLFSAVPLLATYTEVFMPATGAFFVDYLPLFLPGAIFGRIMDESGPAEALADGIVMSFGAGRAITAIVAACPHSRAHARQPRIAVPYDHACRAPQPAAHRSGWALPRASVSGAPPQRSDLSPMSR